MLRIALGSLLMLGMGATPAMAQDYAAKRVVESVDLDDLKAIVGSLGHEVIVEKVIGDVSLSARDGAGTTYLLLGNACDVGGIPGCQGVAMQVRFDPEPGVTDTDLARANYSQAAINTWRDPSDGTIGVTRYVVLDHGITMANLRENVLVLLGITPAIVETMIGE